MNARPSQPDPRQARSGGAGPAGANNMMELSTGGGAGEAPPPPPPRARRRIKTQNLVIAGVIALSIGALYAMRLYGTRSGTNFATVPIDYPLDGKSARLNAEQRRILKDLQLSGKPAQLAMAHINKNPFRLDTESGKFIGPERPLNPEDDDHELERENSIAAKLASLQLNSVMLGRVPIARISGKIYKLEDTVDDVFVIKAIHDRMVELEVNGKTFELTMGEDDDK